MLRKFEKSEKPCHPDCARMAVWERKSLILEIGCTTIVIAPAIAVPLYVIVFLVIGSIYRQNSINC